MTERRFEFEVWTDVPNIRHEIRYRGREYELEIDQLGYGIWSLTDDNGNEVTSIGRRKRWQDALRDALIHIAGESNA